MKVRQAVVMVGGMGTRLRPLTNDRPKPILPVLDRPCLSYLIESLAKGGIEEVILACGYRSEKMKQAIGDGSREGTRIEYSYEDEPMGTAGAIKLLEGRLDRTFVAVNGDVFADFDLRKEIEEHKRTKASVTISLTRVKDPCEFGIARLDADGRITEFKEKPKPEEVFSDLINAGIYVIQKDVLRYVPKGTKFDFSKELTPYLMANGHRIQGHLINGLWMDVGRPKDLLGANLAAAELLGENAGKGTAKGSKITRPFYIGRNGTATDSVLSGAIISAGAKVKDSKISRSLIMADCDISGAVISGSIIGEGCTVAPGSVITDSVIADKIKINGEEITGRTVG